MNRYYHSEDMLFSRLIGDGIPVMKLYLHRTPMGGFSAKVCLLSLVDQEQRQFEVCGLEDLASANEQIVSRYKELREKGNL